LKVTYTDNESTSSAVTPDKVIVKVDSVFTPVTVPSLINVIESPPLAPTEKVFMDPTGEKS
jgi:hypothetical protein